MISGLELNYTTEMEKAMHQNHGVGYAEYELNLSRRLKVERDRYKSYLDSKMIVSEIDRQVHR